MTPALFMAAILTLNSIGYKTDVQAALAAQQAQQIAWQQSGLEPMINSYIEKNTPERARWVTGNLLFVAKTVQDQYVVVKWTFP